MRRASIVLVSLLLVVIGLAACGGSATTTASQSATTTASTTEPTSQASTSTAPAASTPASNVVTVSANTSGALMFSTKSLQAGGGTVTIKFTNSAPEAHNFTLASSDGTTIAATPTFMGGTKTLVVKLKPGSYTYYCSVPGHRTGGMQGTLKIS